MQKAFCCEIDFVDYYELCIHHNKVIIKRLLLCLLTLLLLFPLAPALTCCFQKFL